MKTPAALLAALLVSDAALAQLVAPWVSIERLAATASTHTTLDYYEYSLRFAPAGSPWWSSVGTTPDRRITWWQPEGSADAQQLVVPTPWGAQFGPPERTRVLGVMDSGAAFGSAEIQGANLSSVWVQRNAAPFQPQLLGLDEPRHYGPGGEYRGGVWRFDAEGGTLIGSTGRFDPLPAEEPDYDLWVWRDRAQTVEPFALMEGGRRLALIGYSAKLAGRWAALSAYRPGNSGIFAALLNTETMEMRQLGYTDTDHTVDPGDSILNATYLAPGHQTSQVYAVDAQGNVMGTSRLSTPETFRMVQWLYARASGIYTPIPTNLAPRAIHCPPVADRCVMEIGGGSGSPSSIYFYRPGLASPQEVRWSNPDETPMSIWLNGVWWRGDVPSVVFTSATAEFNDHYPPGLGFIQVYVWRPGLGRYPLTLPGIEPWQTRFGDSKSVSGRYLLLKGPQGLSSGSGFGVYDAETDTVMPLPTSPVTGRSAVAAAFVGERVLLVFPQPTDGPSEALLVGMDGDTLDLSTLLTGALGGRDIAGVTARTDARGARLLVTAYDAAGSPLRATITLIDRCSAADIGSAGAAEGPDRALDNNDFIRFINWFFAADPRADMGKAGGLPGTDGAFDNNDFIAFISAFFAGCP